MTAEVDPNSGTVPVNHPPGRLQRVCPPILAACPPSAVSPERVSLLHIDIRESLWHGDPGGLARSEVL